MRNIKHVRDGRMNMSRLSALAVVAILLAAVLVPAMGLGSLNKVENNKTYVEEQDFTWGVLAINTNKSIYLPDETAFIGMAVLDYEGQMVCDADVTVTITDPGNKETVLSTSNGSIKVSPQCCVYGVTNLPDYYTNYTVGGVGTYVMNLTAATSAGVYTILDNFTVQRSVDFEVARDGPTRIYPVVPYRMNFTIKANKNYNGLVNEYVPASFAISPQEGLTVTTVGDIKILSWNKNLVEGETYKIGYEFDAPDISPYLFVLGDLEIGDWHEAREWMIASDQTGGCSCDTVASGIIHGGIYDESYGKYPAGETYEDENGHTYWKVTHEFQNVPSNIKVARVRTGCWGGSPCNGGDGFNISIDNSMGHHVSANYNAIDPCHNTTLRCDVLNWANNSNPPSTTGVCQLDTTGCGQSYIKYNATPYIVPGSNTITMIQRRATVNPQDWGGSWGSWHGWGAAHGIFFLKLFVLYENESMQEIHYFINEGTTLIIKNSTCEPNSYESFIYFNGSKVYTGSARKVTLSDTAPGATGVSYFNGHNLTGGYPWSDIPPGYLVPFNNLFYYYDDTMPEPGKQIFDRIIWTRMIIEYERSDLTVTNISAQTLYANYYNTINATVLNNVGNVSSFNVTLYANGSKVGVQQVSNISAGESKEVSFTWKPTSEGIYELNVTADAEDIVLETNEANNTKTEIVNVEPAPVPIWRNQSSNVSSIPVGGSIELRAQGSAKHGLDYAVLWTDETGTWMGCNNYGSPMEMFSLQSDSFTHTSDADWTAQTRENLAVAAGDVKLLWTEAGANIALSQPSYASSYEYCEGPGDGNDGDDGYTYWYAVCPEDYTYDWWYVDLGEIKNVGKIVIKDVCYLGTYGHYDIQISDDASSWTTKIADQTDEGLVTFNGLDWSCRYVRFYVEHNEGAGFAEFEVYKKAGYKSSGLLTSTATSTGNPIVSVTPTWNSYEPAETSLSVNVSVDNGATWKPANKDEELTWDYDVPNTNLKYKVLFETTNTSKTPVLHDITLNYKTKNAPKETWVWSNFTWQNASVTAGTTVAWKICYNDTAGQTTCTDVMTFDVAAPDTTPPYTAGHDPASGATGVPRNTNITVHVKDDGEGVDESTIVMKVDGNPVAPVISGSPADYTLVYDPPDFDFWQEVHVTVDASDLASPPNEMTTDSYSFTVVGDKPDLIIKNITAYHNATGYPPYFNLSNEVDVVIENVGGVASGASNVSLYINESFMGKTDVPGLAVLSNTTVQFTWTPSGCDCEDGCNPDTFILEAIADCDGVITELNESNNASSTTETAYWNGYSADELLVEAQHGTIHGGLNFTTGDGSYTSLTTHGSSKDIHYNLTLPSGATVALARLNVYYLWSKYDYPIMTVNITNQTGTHTVPLSKSYNDRPCSSPGVSSNYPSGNYVYNVTPYITGSGDYTVTVKNDGNETNESSFAIYAPGLVILYEDSTAPEYEYWILEGADMLEGGRKSGSGNLALAECINNATLPGIDKSGVETATLGLVTPAGDGSGSDSYLYFNGNEIGTDVYHGHGSHYNKTLNGIAMHIGSTNAQVGVNVTDVKEYLDTSSNVVGQRDDGDSMTVANVFLLVEQVAVSDITPPMWATTGIQSAIDTGVGGEVTVTYGNATDTDSPPVKYNIYYNISSPATGGTKKSDVGSSPYTVTGLTNGQQYYFAVRVEDSATPPNEDTNTVELPATPTDTTPPASITGLASTSGNFWINWIWTNPADSDFNHTMVYINGTFEKNVSKSTPYYNDTYTPHATKTISTHTVDMSGNVNDTWVNLTSTIPNNAPVLAAIGDKTVDEGQTLNIDTDATDLDDDTRTYSCNRTDLFTDFNTTTGSGNWTPASGQAGEYYVDFGVSDGYGGIDNETIKITVNDKTPPASISGLQNVTYEQTYINWSWTNPGDADFNYTMVYINGTRKENVSSPFNYYNATGLSPNTNNTISTHTVDTSGNVNLSWVNHSAWTAPTPPPAPIIKLRREQANTTGVNQATTVRLIVWNTDSSENNITSLNLTEWIDSDWAVTDCGGCDENTSTYIKWNLGDLPKDNYTMVSYKIKAPASSEISTFKANCTYKYDGKTESEEGSEFLVSVQTGKAFFDFELDMNAFTPTIDRDVPEGTEKTVLYSVTNVGDAAPCDTVFIELQVNKTAWNVTCAYCDEFYNDTDYYYLRWIENESSWDVQETKVFNFTVNSSHVGYYNFTSNGTYDPPASAFTGQIYYKMAGMSLSASPDPEEANANAANEPEPRPEPEPEPEEPLIKLIKDGKTYVEEQDFTWGVLAINAHKSIYLPNETAFIGMAVLDDEGHMVCDAAITLTITDPSNKETVLSTGNGSIKVSPQCCVYGVTNLPDYYTNYEVNGVGTYVMNLTAVTADGTKSITDDFTVQNLVDFDVARDGPTRIYPPVPYAMNFTIKANQDYNGPLSEYVPASFDITPQQGLTVTTAGDTKILTWNKNLAKEETYNIYYEFDAPPDVSPYLFTLGRLQIGSFEEKRDWMIASDTPDVETLDPIVHVNTELNGVDLTQAQVDDITINDTNNVEVDKGLLLTVEFNDTSQTIGTLNDAYCSLTYSTDAGFAGNGNFQVYDSFGWDLIDTATIPESTSDNTIHLIDLETKGLSASKVATMVVYAKNTVAGKPYSFYVDKIVCTIDYTPSADTTPPTYTNDGDNSSGSVTEGAIVETHVYWTDADSNLGKAVLRTNKTGSWENESWHTFAGNPEWANVTFDTTGNAGKTICWAQWANDTSNNNNWNTSMSTTAHCFNVLQVTKISQVLINDTNPNQGDSVKIEAKLEYDNGTAIADQNISFYYDTSYIDSDFSNETGWATVLWDTTGVNNGTYNINATYSGNSSIYTEASYNNTQEVTVTEKIWVTNIEVHFVRVKPAAAMDTTPPASITSLHNTTYAPTYINWSWTKPADADFSHVMVYIDGTFKENVFSSSNYYNATGFTANTQHTISTHTVDTSGNVNLSWVNHSAWTAPAPAGAPTVEIITITPDDSGEEGVQINPVPNSTKTVTVTAQVNDPNGYEDIQTVKVSNINPAPTQGSTATMNYVSGSGSGTTATYEGTFDMQFYEASTTYTVTVTATDTGDLTGSNSSPFKYQTCIALALDTTSIAFSSVDPGGYKEVIGDIDFATTAKPTIKNCGNLKIDMKISGTNMSGSGTILVNNIYDDLLGDGYTALSTTPAEHDELNLTAGASSVHGIDFKLNVPSGTSAGDYLGTVTLEAKQDD